MTKKPIRAAIYARVSTKNGQTPQNQILRLREVADKAGWEVVEEFVDRGISGAKGRDKRPAFDRLCKAATRRDDPRAGSCRAGAGQEGGQDPGAAQGEQEGREGYQSGPCGR